MNSFNQTGLEVAWTPGRKGYPAHSLTVTVKGTFRMKPNGVATLVEEGEALLVDGDRHIGDDTQKSLKYTTDFAFYKPKTDLLFKGSCYVPDGKAEELCKISFGLKGEQKSLYVFGDRQWQNSMLGGKEPGKTKPFSKMPLCYENSFGGEGFEANPVGKGVNNEDMPNIEHPDHLILSSNDQPQPVGFAPIHSLWQPRKSKMGTFSKQWENERWPWFPADMDWSLFNAAPAALQREGFLKGDETVVLENLHPSIPSYHCRLPELRCRCFINGENANQVKNFREVALNLDTLWVDGDEELMVLVWRGVLPITDRFHEELNHLLLVTEPLASPPQTEQVYRDQLAAELKALEPEVFIPPAATTEEPLPPAQADPNSSAEVKKAMEEARASLKGLNLPPEKLEALNREQDPSAYLELLMKALGMSSEDADKLQHEAFLKNRQLLENHGYDPNLAGRLNAERIESREDVIQYYSEGRDFSGTDLSNLDLRGLDLSNAELSLTLMVNTQLNNTNLSGANLSDARLNKADLSGARLDAANLNKSSFNECQLTGASLVSAQLNEAKLAHSNLAQADATEAKMHKARFDQCILTDAKLKRADLSEASLTKADLSRADLSECNASLANFSESIMNNVNIENGDLSEAILNHVSLQHANLSAALLGKAQLKRADMQTATLTNVQADSAILDDANMENAILDGSDFSAASMNRVTLSGASMVSTLFRATQLELAMLQNVSSERVDFSRAHMPNANFQNSMLAEANFSAADVSGADFEQANLTRGNFTGSIAIGVNMKQADLTELRAGGGSNFDQANLQQVNAPGAVWMQSSLRQANLTWADMPRCNLNQADLTGAQCIAADIKKTDFTRADLTDANLSNCNLFESQFEGANFTKTNFSGSNMYGAFFMDNVVIGGEVEQSQFYQTNLKRTRIEEWDDAP
jgi:uncharacterized protein YjbI with pentapeptide repeats